jgi:short-subunit dehydrogenase
MHDRADLDISKVPEVMWLKADRLVRDCLDDVKAGKVISIPGVQYKLLTGIAKLAPRGVVRGLSGRAASIRRSKD